jgi:glycosyltransferase involved in cell wall biosynthesis
MALFFTEAVSLKIWDEAGILSREIEPYIKLGNFFDEIFFITYGSNDMDYADKLGKKIKILPKKINVPDRIYSFLIPFLYKNELRTCDWFKTNQMLGSWSAVLAKWMLKKKLVIRCGYQFSQSPQNWKMGILKKFIAWIIEFISYKNADSIILTTVDAKEYVIKKYLIKSEKILVISNSINTDLFRPMSVGKKARSLIFVGRVEKEKNLEELVNAMVGSGATLDIVGSGSQIDYLSHLAKNLGVEVNFLGKVSNHDLPAIINQHEIFVLPSKYEGNPKALLEAMACGMVVLGTDVRGIREIIKHQENGYLSATNRVELSKSLVILFTDQNLRKKISTQARLYALNNSALEETIKKELVIYH